MNTTDTTVGRALEALRAAIAGQVFVPGEAGFDQARQAWNLAVEQKRPRPRPARCFRPPPTVACRRSKPPTTRTR